MKIDCKNIVAEGKPYSGIVELNLNMSSVKSVDLYRSFIKRALQQKIGKKVDNFIYKILTF